MTPKQMSSLQKKLKDISRVILWGGKEHHLWSQEDFKILSATPMPSLTNCPRAKSPAREVLAPPQALCEC